MTKSAQDYFEAGVKNYLDKNYGAAIADFDKAIDLDPKFASAYNGRGASKDNLGEYEAAIADYDKAIKLNPEFVSAYNGRGNSKYNLGEYEAAITDYNEAITLDPKYVLAYNGRGNSKGNLGKYEAAITDYNEAIDLDPKHVPAYNGRGKSKNDLGEYEAAIADYNEAIKLDPEFVHAYNGRGNSKHNLGEYEAAIIDYNEAIELDPKYVDAYNGQGNSKNKLGEYEAAIIDYDKAIELNSEYVHAYFGRGYSKECLEEYEAAITDYTKAIKLEPKYAAAYYNRGCAYQKLGKTNEAKNDFLKVIPLTRENISGSLSKYIPINEHQLLSLINNEVYFALPTQLNDPLECFFLNRDSEMGASFQQNDIEPRICSMVKECSDTEGSRSTLMFAHYANEHKGICVEYEIDLERVERNDRIAFGEVIYEQKKETENLKDLYMLKDPAWKYEEEFRLVRFDNKEYMEAKVKRITFGLKCPQTHRDIIRHLLPLNIDYSEMSHGSTGNQIIKKKVDWADKTANNNDIFKLMLKENLAHLYFYHQHQTK